MSETHPEPAAQPAAQPHVTPDIAPAVPPAFAAPTASAAAAPHPPEPPLTPAPAATAPTSAPAPAPAPAAAAGAPGPVSETTPGTTIANPAHPLAPTVLPEPAPKASFIQQVETFLGYPKTKYHPVHGGVTVNDPNEEASLAGPPTDWFDSPELADASRTWTEAHIAGAANTRAKLAALDAAGLPIVRNSAAAHEAISKGTPEPL